MVELEYSIKSFFFILKRGYDYNKELFINKILGIFNALSYYKIKTIGNLTNCIHISQ